jgi:hypothetical protein
MPKNIPEKEKILWLVSGGCVQAFEEQGNQRRIKQDADLPDQKIIYGFISAGGTIRSLDHGAKGAITNLHNSINARS